MRSRTVYWALVALVSASVALPVGSAVFEPFSAPAESDLASVEAGGLEGPLKDPASCAADWTEEEILASDAYLETLAHYKGMTGFVDLFLIHGEEGRFLLALFDMDARGDEPLPASVGPVLGFEVVVDADRFKTLESPLMALDEAAPPLIPQTCSSRISPGVRITTNVGCSANFIFRDQSGILYFGTAGHCTSFVGQRVSVNGLGQSGTVVYRINGNVGSDFALVRVDGNKQGNVNPAMCHWGGPEDIAIGTAGLARHYGYPVLWGNYATTRPRSAYGTGGSTTSFTMAGTVASGDSGSGAQQASGGALGTVTHVNVGLVLFAHSAPYAFGTKISRGMDLAEAATGLELELLTAPLA